MDFNRVFHYKPSILGYPYFWKHPYKPLIKCKLSHLAFFVSHKNTKIAFLLSMWIIVFLLFSRSKTIGRSSSSPQQNCSQDAIFMDDFCRYSARYRFFPTRKGCEMKHEHRVLRLLPVSLGIQSPSENGFMEPKYLAFRRWLYTPCSSSDKVIGSLGSALECSRSKRSDKIHPTKK